MDMEKVREYFLSKPGTSEQKPFNIPVPVFKVGSKMYGLINCHEPSRPSINLKYYKEDIEGLRSVHKEVQPGYHMNKSHWNTVYLDGSLKEDKIKELIDISYELVFKSLKKDEQKKVLLA